MPGQRSANGLNQMVAVPLRAEMDHAEIILGMVDFSRVDTERLTLTRPTSEDLDEMHQMYADPRV